MWEGLLCIFWPRTAEERITPIFEATAAPECLSLTSLWGMSPWSTINPAVMLETFYVYCSKLPFLSYEFMRNYNGDYPKIRCVGITLCMLVVYDVHQPTTYFQSRSTNAQHEPTMAPCGRQFTRHHVCGEAAACRPWGASRAHFWSRWLFQFKLPKVEGWCWIIALDTCTQLPGPLPITDVGIFGVTWWFLMLQLRKARALPRTGLRDGLPHQEFESTIWLFNIAMENDDFPIKTSI